MKSRVSSLLVGMAACLAPLPSASAVEPTRSNVLLIIADDWGWPFAGAYGDKAVKTPNFDRLGREGVLFRNAFVSSPSCTPSRAALLTGQHFWRLEESANLWSTFSPKFASYPEILQSAGYAIGSHGKAWGPGDLRAAGRTNNPAGAPVRNLETFLKAKPRGQPFCFWQGSSDPHRPYDAGSGARAGINAGAASLPACWPDSPVVRQDLADYYFEIQRFDALVGSAIAALESAGELDRTLVVVTGDNGAPFPRGKTQLYDLGVRVPLAIRWGPPGPHTRVSEALVSLTDLAPTFLEVAGLNPAREMTGASMVKLLKSGSDRESGWRDYVVFGRERHTLAQEDRSLLACPMRAIRTHEYVYIWNMFPERWPAGMPPAFRDCDDGPTKRFFLDHESDPAVKPLLDLAFAQRPAVEIYDMVHDPGQTNNLARRHGGEEKVRELEKRLKSELLRTGDPRLRGGQAAPAPFDSYPYYGNALPGPKPGARQKKNSR